MELYRKGCLGKNSHSRHTHGGKKAEDKLGEYYDAVFVNICLDSNYEGGNLQYWEFRNGVEVGKSIEFTRPGHVSCWPSNYAHAVSPVVIKDPLGCREQLILVVRLEK